MLERRFMNQWIADHMRQHPNDRWIRIPDTSEGVKPFDGILLCKGRPVALEFKVWRKRKPFDMSSVEPHQLRELLLWEKGGGIAKFVVLHEQGNEVRLYRPTKQALRRAIR